MPLLSESAAAGDGASSWYAVRHCKAVCRKCVALREWQSWPSWARRCSLASCFRRRSTTCINRSRRIKRFKKPSRCHKSASTIPPWPPSCSPRYHFEMLLLLTPHPIPRRQVTSDSSIIPAGKQLDYSCSYNTRRQTSLHLYTTDRFQRWADAFLTVSKACSLNTMPRFPQTRWMLFWTTIKTGPLEGRTSPSSCAISFYTVVASLPASFPA